MDWNDVRYFLTLARKGAVRTAGADLGVSHSTVTRRIEALEEKLGTKLFDRHRDGFILTAAGRRMKPVAERIETEMASLERDLVGQDQAFTGTVSITCCDEFVSNMVFDRLADLMGEHPDLDLCLSADSRPFDLSKREADLAIRILGLNQQPPAHLIGRVEAPIYLANYVAGAHEARLRPDDPDSPARWLAFEDRRFLTNYVKEGPYPHLPLWGNFSNVALMAQATRRGLGICTLPCYVGDGDAALKRLPLDGCQHVANLWLLSHPDLKDNARIQGARDAVRAGLAEHLPLFRGDR